MPSAKAQDTTLVTFVLECSRLRLPQLMGWNRWLTLESYTLTQIRLHISGLESLRNLSGLYIGSNNISNITGLEKLKNLVKLKLGANKISEIKGLETVLEKQPAASEVIQDLV